MFFFSQNIHLFHMPRKRAHIPSPVNAIELLNAESWFAIINRNDYLLPDLCHIAQVCILWRELVKKRVYSQYIMMKELYLDFLLWTVDIMSFRLRCFNRKNSSESFDVYNFVDFKQKEVMFGYNMDNVQHRSDSFALIHSMMKKGEHDYALEFFCPSRTRRITEETAMKMAYTCHVTKMPIDRNWHRFVRIDTGELLFRITRKMFFSSFTVGDAQAAIRCKQEQFKEMNSSVKRELGVE